MKKLLLLCCSLISIYAFAQTNDTIAIRQVLEKESASWRSGDVKAHADCWHIRPYSKILVSTPAGKCFDIAPESIVHPAADMIGKGGTFQNSNYQFSIHGENAWVSHDEKSTSKDGTVSYSHEIRILEKISGQWKLVAQSIHVYVP
jgi:hypothetical protein